MKLKMREDKLNFLAQDPATRRVMLAQDVINQINTKRLLARTGEYISIRKVGGSISEEMNGEPVEYDLCMAAQDETKVCVVCARGGLLMARLGYQHPADEDCTADQIHPDHNLSVGSVNMVVLTEDFTVEQIELIESAFEVVMMMTETNDANLVRRAICFGSNFSTSHERMLAIMQNIIDNNGEFDPGE